MAWWIKGDDLSCQEQTLAQNIVDLIRDHTSPAGWFLCRCGQRGHIERSFKLQEPAEVWEPILKGIVPLGDAGDSYQPFVFLVAKSVSGPVDAIWFSYYKDLRPAGGRLKLGYGPGGPPVLAMRQCLDLLRGLADRGLLQGDLS